MKFLLKNCTDGREPIYKTEFSVSEECGRLTFMFDARNSQCFCCDSGYNKIHSLGDVCEILIGTDPQRKLYYEIEISPRGELMIAKMTNSGVDSQGKPILDIDFVEKPFIDAAVRKTESGYVATLTFDKEKIITGEGEIYFNAYRIETDGGEAEKYLFALNPTMQGRFHVPDKFVWLKEYV